MKAEKPRDPFLKFYSQAWFGDTNLRLCSPAARGIWIDLLMLMHQDGEPYGYLSRGDSVIPNRELSVIASVELGVLESALDELEARGVFSRDAKGRIYSRKMVRDANRRHINRLNGALGGNPQLPRKKRISDRDNRIGKGAGNPPRINTRTPDIKEKTEISVRDTVRALPSAEELRRRDEVRASFGLERAEG